MKDATETLNQTKANTHTVHAQILRVADEFIDTFVSAMETVIDPHDERALTNLILEMSKDNVTKAKLPRYAAGTTFAKILKALGTFSQAATSTCTPGMARAANYTRGDNANNTNEDNNAGLNPRPSPLSYLHAAQKARKPITRLPSAAADGTPQTIAEDATFSAKLRARAIRMNETWVGHEQKQLMQITSDTLFASPTHLRQILSFSGVRASSLSYLPMTHHESWSVPRTVPWMI